MFQQIVVTYVLKELFTSVFFLIMIFKCLLLTIVLCDQTKTLISFDVGRN